jgi:tetratricopeptide (TPR) repeat protein
MLHWQQSLFMSTRMQIAGDIEAAEQHADDAVRFARLGNEGDGESLWAAQRAAIASQRGVVQDQHEGLSQLVREWPLLEDLLVALMAANHVRFERVDDAHDLLRRFADRGCRLPPVPGSWIQSMIAYAEVALACHDNDVAAVLVNELTPFGGQLPAAAITVVDPVSTTLGRLATELGRFDEAQRWFEQCLQFTQQHDARYFDARARLAYAEMLVVRGRRDDRLMAREMVSAARRTAIASGYQAVERDADAR